MKIRKHPILVIILFLLIFIADFPTFSQEPVIEIPVNKPFF